MSRLFRLLPGALFLALCSCASVSVKKEERFTTGTPQKAPAKIFVQPFTFNEGGVRANRSGRNLKAFEFDVQEWMVRHLVKRLKANIAPAQAVAQNAPLPQGNYWLVTGRFDRVNQGSRLLRAALGYGLGGTKLETTVEVWDLSQRPKRLFLRLETTGGSNSPPGAVGALSYTVGGVTALGSLGGIAEGVRAGVTLDVIRTSREITASLSEYLHSQGSLPDRKPLKSKPLGSLPNWWWPFKPRPDQTGSVTVEPAPQQR